MPLLRSRTAVHRMRFAFLRRFFAVMAIVTILFGGVLAGHYLLGLW